MIHSRSIPLDDVGDAFYSIRQFPSHDAAADTFAKLDDALTGCDLAISHYRFHSPSDGAVFVGAITLDREAVVIADALLGTAAQDVNPPEQVVQALLMRHCLAMMEGEVEGWSHNRQAYPDGAYLMPDGDMVERGPQ